MAFISLKNAKEAIKVMMEILAMLDKIYHAMMNNVTDKTE